jgi:hypothetical protein
MCAWCGEGESFCAWMLYLYVIIGVRVMCVMRKVRMRVCVMCAWLYVWRCIYVCTRRELELRTRPRHTQGGDLLVDTSMC